MVVDTPSLRNPVGGALCYTFFMQDWWLLPQYRFRKRLNPKILLWCGIFFAVLVTLIILWSPASGSKQFFCEGIYIESSMYHGHTSRASGDKVFVNLHFILDSGESILMKKDPWGPALLPGERVRIYFQKGRIFNNNYYTNYERI